MRRLAAVLVAVPLLLGAVACGSSAPAAKPQLATPADVSVSGPTSAAPKINFHAPITFRKTASRTVDAGPGTGPAVQPDSLVTISYVAMNAADGSVYDSSWSSGKPKTFPLDSVIKGIGVGLTGARAGDRVLICIASKDGYDPTGNGGSIKPGDSLVLVVDVVRVQNPLKEATGTKVSPPDTVPSLTLDKAGTPSKFTATSKTLKKPTQLGVYPLIEGNGPVVKSGQTIRVEYVGQLYPDGKVFDSSWTNGQPATFQIGVGQVIKAWDQGLVGQHVGSRVVLVVPAKLGYGKSGHPPAIPGKADLVFAVDILQAY